MAIFGAVKKLLMKVARAALNQVIQTLNGLIQQALEQVLNPVQSIIQEILGGDIWRGAGANAFAEELANILVPDVDRLIQSGQKGVQSIVNAEQIMSQADKEVSNLVNGFADIVAGIF